MPILSHHPWVRTDILPTTSVGTDRQSIDTLTRDWFKHSRVTHLSLPDTSQYILHSLGTPQEVKHSQVNHDALWSKYLNSKTTHCTLKRINFVSQDLPYCKLLFETSVVIKVDLVPNCLGITERARYTPYFQRHILTKGKMAQKMKLLMCTTYEHELCNVISS